MKAADVGFVVATRPCGGYAVHLPSKKHYSDEGSERFLVQVPG